MASHHPLARTMDTTTTTSPPTLAPSPATDTLSTTVRQTAAGVAQAVQRLDSVDLFRGLIMVIMLIDHTRDYVLRDGMRSIRSAWRRPLPFSTSHVGSPTSAHQALPCWRAPALVFNVTAALPFHALALSLDPGLSLVVMELTIIRVVSSFNVDPNYLANLQVIWVIGASMVVLAALVHLPQRAILTIGLVIVCGHNLLDSIKVPAWTSPTMPAPSALGKLWMVMHQNGLFPLFGVPVPMVRVNYPLLPWIGVLAVGYVLADVWLLPTERRRRVLGVGIGADRGVRHASYSQPVRRPAALAAAGHTLQKHRQLHERAEVSTVAALSAGHTRSVPAVLVLSPRAHLHQSTGPRPHHLRSRAHVLLSPPMDVGARLRVDFCH